MSTIPKREYLGLDLGNIGEELPNNFFASQKTMNTIIEKIQNDMITPWNKTETEKKKN